MKKLLIIFICCYSLDLFAQHSVARVWNDVLLESIREDFARPTVHARNLFHISAAKYDAWSIYNNNVNTYFIGKKLNKTLCSLGNFEMPNNLEEATETAISYAAFKMLLHRFKNSPNRTETYIRIYETMYSLNLDPSIESIDYINDGPAALGNYIAECYIEYGLQDGANEENLYQNTFYTPVNSPLNTEESGIETLSDPDRWQPLKLDVNIDQSGNVISEDITSALSPE